MPRRTWNIDREDQYNTHNPRSNWQTELRERAMDHESPLLNPPTEGDWAAGPAPMGEQTPWPFEVTEQHPHPSDLDQTQLYRSWTDWEAARNVPIQDKVTSPTHHPTARESASSTPPSQDYYGAEGGSFGYQAPAQQMPPRPELPAAPPAGPTADQLNLPQVPDFYSGISTQIDDPYADMYPGSGEADRLRAAAQRVSDAVVGKTTLSQQELSDFGITGTPDVRDVVRLTQAAESTPQDRLVGDHYWGDVQDVVDREVAQRTDHYAGLSSNVPDYYGGISPHIPDYYSGIDLNIPDRYSDLDGTLTDRYEGMDFEIPDYYEDITPVGYEHYLGLDPTQPDYYSKLEDLIEDIGFDYDPLTPEQKRELAEEYAAIEVDPQISAINRAIEQSKLDADSHEARIRAAASPFEEALARREEAKSRKDLENAIARGMGETGAVEWLSAERQGYHLEKLANHEERVNVELTAIANQLGLTKRQMEERKIELEALRGQLTNQELQRLREQEWERQVKGNNWMFEASLAVADRLAQTERWEYEQAAHVADRLTQIDQFNSQQEMSIADRKTALDQWMKEMDITKADRQTALEQWEKERELQIADRLTSLDQWMKEMEIGIADRKTAVEKFTKQMELSIADSRTALAQWQNQFDLELAHGRARQDESFRNWETNTRMALGDRRYEANLQDFHANLQLRDRTYQQAADEFARELQIADRLTQRDIDEMARALDVYDRTQLNTGQQYQLWLTMAEIAGVFPDRLPGT